MNSSKTGKQNLKSYYSGKKVLVTAGPTFEPIDPVRFIGNRSSGKMGICVAEAFASQDAEVTLVLGPTHLTTENENINLVRVGTAADMYEACIAANEEMDIAVMAAAVADYTPIDVADQKIKKKGGNLMLELTRTKDILKTLGGLKKDHQIIVGFALETSDEMNHAQGKLKNKNADMIVLNSLRNKGAGFRHDTNQVTFIDKYNNIVNFELKSKKAVADDIVQHITKLIDAKNI